VADTPDRDEKTEDPTAKRRQDAVEKGDVLQSKELGTALVVLGGGAWLALVGPLMLGSLTDMLGRALQFDRAAVTGFDPGQAIWRALEQVSMPLFALFGITLLAAIGTPAMLGSLGFRASAFAFKPDKLNPMSGMKRVLGKQGLIELGKSLLKVVMLGAVGWWLLRDQATTIMSLSRADLPAALGELGSGFVTAVLVMAMALVLIAGVDIPAQIFQRSGRLRMTKQEVKDESKQSEGNPEMKGAQRRRAAEMLRGSARQAVTEASVVITNPTHFAIALRYRAGTDAAPVCVARGRGETAAAIRQLAAEGEVPVLSYPQLARALYYTTRAGQVIREDLYLAVATILAFVFNLDEAQRARTPPPVIDVPADVRFDEEGRKI
jgi:flagellar biosynthetic protein FlhB